MLVCDLDVVDADEARAGSACQSSASTRTSTSRPSKPPTQPGIDLAVPRSRMARELPQLVDKLLA